MAINVTCPNCQGRFNVPDRALGKRFKCSDCQHVYSVAAGSATVRQQESAESWWAKTDDGQEYGPIPRSQLDDWVNQGRVMANWQVLRDGTEQWQWASDVYPQLAIASGAGQPAAAASSSLGDVGQSLAEFLVDTANAATRPQPGQRQQFGAKRRTDKRAPPSGVVTAVAVVDFIYGTVQALYGLGLMLTGLRIAEIFRDFPAAKVGTFIVMIGLILLALGCLEMIAGFGILQRAEWGRLLTLIFSWLAGVGAIIILNFAYGTHGIVNALVSVTYVVFVLVILLNKKYAAEFA